MPSVVICATSLRNWSLNLTELKQALSQPTVAAELSVDALLLPNLSAPGLVNRHTSEGWLVFHVTAKEIDEFVESVKHYYSRVYWRDVIPADSDKVVKPVTASDGLPCAYSLVLLEDWFDLIAALTLVQ